MNGVDRIFSLKIVNLILDTVFYICFLIHFY